MTNSKSTPFKWAIPVLLVVFFLSPLRAPAQPIQVDDTVVTTVDHAPVMSAGTTLLTLRIGAVLSAQEINGDWVLVTVEQGGNKTTGWVYAKHLARTTRSAAAVPLSNPAPDVPPFSSGEGRFSVSFPGTPMVLLQEGKTTFGKFVNHMFVVGQGDGTFYVSYADFPRTGELDPEAGLDRVVSGGIAGVKGTLIASQRIVQSGSPGREVSFTCVLYSRPGMGRARYYVVGHRLYQVLVIGTEPLVQSPAAEDFLKSFKFEPIAEGNAGR